jgi:homoserine kinase type II
MPPDDATELKEILSHFDLGELVDLEKNERGYINTAFAIEVVADGRRSRFFLRKYKAGIREEEILFEHSLIEHLCTSGSCPVARLQKTREGKTYLRQPAGPDGEEVFYAIFDFLPGEDRYTWVGPRCHEQEIKNAAIVLAQFHTATRTFRPLGRRAEPKIAELLPVIAENWAASPGKSKGTEFDCYLCEHLELVSRSIAKTLAVLEQPEVQQLPQIVIHCDFHPGNLKYERNEVTGLFDFDWSKIDLRAFDVALALYYFFTTWEGQQDGYLRLEEVGTFLDAYQEFLRETPGVGPLNEAELRHLPVLINASNLYVLNWTVPDYYNKDVDPEEYLVFLRHGVNFTAWYEQAGNQEALERVCMGAARRAPSPLPAAVRRS